MYHHLRFIPILLFLSTLSDALALVPRAASDLQRRHPAPVDVALWRPKPAGPAYAWTAADFVPTARDSAPPPRLQALDPERQVAGTSPASPKEPASDKESRVSDEKAGASGSGTFEPYPTQVTSPSFSIEGSRLLAGAIVLNRDQSRVLLLMDRINGEYRLPEGDWALNEAHIAEAAAREVHGTAGVISVWQESVPLGRTATAESETHYFQIQPLGLSKYWPGFARWKKEWQPVAEASALLHRAHPEQAVILALRKPWPSKKPEPPSS